ECITTTENLQNVSADEIDKLQRVPIVLRTILKLNHSIHNRHDIRDQDKYQQSKVTLLSDIHRVRRYFYYILKNIHLQPYLSPDIIDLAIKEVELFYKDDGNVLSTIKNYLNTFCYKESLENKLIEERKKQQWHDELETYLQAQELQRSDLKTYEDERNTVESDVKIHDNHYKELLRREKDTKQDCDNRRQLAHQQINNSNLLLNTTDPSCLTLDDIDAVELKMKTEKAELEMEILKLKTRLTELNNLIRITNNTIDLISTKINNLQEYVNLDFTSITKHMKIKYGRGLLLYGPPGTGKGEY
ncbi:unnamed protein product, partial [Didymodactylos carnosus]